MMNFHLGIAFKIADEWDIKQGSTLFFFSSQGEKVILFSKGFSIVLSLGFGHTGMYVLITAQRFEELLLLSTRNHFAQKKTMVSKMNLPSII